MDIIADCHTHTVACDHAYSTVTENCGAAAERGLNFIAMTEHAPAMPGTPAPVYFANLRVIPNVVSGVVLLKGVEANILDSEGTLDLPDRILSELDWVIASMHVPTFKPAGKKEHTDAWLAVVENPLVDVLGHTGDGRYPFDMEAVIKACARHNKIVEINAHSFSVRPGSEVNCPKIARICAKEGVRVIVDSDAHYCASVGRVQPALDMLAELDFPEELVVNSSYERFLPVAREKAFGPMREYLDSLR